MLIFLCQGGESTITVYAPAGSRVTASGGGEDLGYKDVPSGGSVTFKVHTIATWSVECTYHERTITKTVPVTSFGTSPSVTFGYASLTVYTYSGATVTISKTGSSSQTKTASGGSAVFYLTENEFDSSNAWNVSCSYSSWSNSGTKSITSATSYSITVSLAVPAFTFTYSGGSKVVTPDTATSGSTSQYYYYRNGVNWEFYMKVDGTLTFASGATVDIFLCGGGKAANNPSGINNGCYGGDGGARKTVSNVSFGAVAVSVDVGGQGENSGFGSYTSSGGAVSLGGRQNDWTFYNGQDGGYSFDSSSAKGPDGTSRKVGAGGGHGGYSETDGVHGMTVDPTNGGAVGGGAGGAAHIDGSEWWCRDGGNGSYFGAGGGGAGGYYHMEHDDRRAKGTPGAGYPGFVAIRNKR